MQKQTQKFLAILLSIAMLFSFPIVAQASQQDNYEQTFTGTYTAPENARNVLVSGATVSEWYGDRVNMDGHTYSVRQNEYGLNKDGNMIEAELDETYTLWLAQYGVASLVYTADEDGIYSIFSTKSETYGHAPEFLNVQGYVKYTVEDSDKEYYSCRSYQYGAFYDEYNEYNGYNTFYMEKGETIYIAASASNGRDCVYELTLEKYSEDKCHHSLYVNRYYDQDYENCTEKKEMRCSYCDYSEYTVIENHDYECIYTPLGDDWYYHTHKCASCGKVDDLDAYKEKHHYVREEFSDGCKQTTRWVCEGCGDIEDSDTYEEHYWDYVREKVGDCEYKYAWKCLDCGKEDEDDVYYETEHNYEWIEETKGCVTTSTSKCSVCGDVDYSDTYTNHENILYEEVTDQCKSGYQDICIACGEIINDYSYDNHNLNYEVYKDTVNGCTSTRAYQCTECNKFIDTTTKEHYDSTLIAEKGCAEDYKCNICGKEFRKWNHNFGEQEPVQTYDDTCCTTIYTTTCIKCGYEKKEKETNHYMDEAERTVGCYTYYYRQCVNCSYNTFDEEENYYDENHDFEWVNDIFDCALYQYQVCTECGKSTFDENESYMWDEHEIECFTYKKNCIRYWDWKCVNCGYIQDSEGEENYREEHNYKDVYEIQGNKIKWDLVCEDCGLKEGENYWEDLLIIDGHKYHIFNADYDDEVTPIEGTDCVKGKLTYHCLDEGCNETYADEFTIHYGGKEYVQVTPQHDNVCGTYNFACASCGELEYEEALTCHSNTEGWNDGGCVYSKTCARCGNEEKNEWHNFSETVRTSPATCTEDKYDYYVCEDCGEKVIDKVYEDSKIPHSYRETENPVADCIHDGTYIYTCRKCGDSYTKTAPATGVHNYGIDRIVKHPTCAEDGESQRACQVCGDIKSEVIPATGEHTYNSGVVTKKPTCVEPGEMTFSCTVCEVSYKEPIDATDVHDYIHKTIDPTCGNDGEEIDTCSMCGDTKSEVIPATGKHTYGSGEITKQPTCKEPGEQTFTCTGCDAFYTEPINVLGEHKYEKVITPADCGNDGKIVYTCVSCGYTYTEILNATGNHSYNDGVITKDATCVSIGVKTFTCAVCSDSYTETIPATGIHLYDDGTVTLEPSCSKTGIKTYKCTVCVTKETEVLPATGVHNYKTTTIPATCGAAGIKIYTCDCGDTYTDTNAIPPTGNHTFGESKVIKQPTCVDAGEAVKACTECNTSVIDVVPATGKHTFKDYVSNNDAKESTCSTSGVTDSKTAKCEYCDATDTKKGATIPVIPGKHVYGESQITPATCINNGWEIKKCIYCGNEAKDIIPKTGKHTYKTTTIQPTCFDDGKIVYTCEVCKDSYEEIIKAPNAHSYSDEVSTKPATCVSFGEKTYSCTRCGNTLNIPDAPPTGKHTFSKTATSTKAATCGVNGVKTYKCTGCNEVKTEAIPATGKHNYVAKVTKAPTSKAAGTMTYTCSVCKGSYTKSIAKLANASISKLTASKKGFKAQWKKVSSATGYQIRYSTSSKMTKAKTVTIGKNSTLSKSVTKLSAKKKYYVQIRTYKTINGSKYYSSWSKAKAVTTKK